MFDAAVEWCNRALLAWYDPSNPTHILLLSIIGTMLSGAVLQLVVWLFLKSRLLRQYATVDKQPKTRRYLKSLEKRARMAMYWQRASAAQRIHFVVLRVAIVLGGFITILACQGFWTFGQILLIQRSKPHPEI